jgi:hypothetical protein
MWGEKASEERGEWLYHVEHEPNRGFHALGSGQEKQHLLLEISTSNFIWDNGN